jgi:hypothetical protein
MLLYNITYLIPTEITKAWLEWMKEKHIPAIMETKLFEKNTLLQLINIDEKDGLTFALQLYIVSELKYDEYEKNFAPTLRLDAKQVWGEEIMSFRTLMRIVQ